MTFVDINKSRAMPPSRLWTVEQQWETTQEYQQACAFDSKSFLEVTDLLLQNPNLNSSHLFRADILHDNAHQLRNLSEKEKDCELRDSEGEVASRNETELPNLPPHIPGANLDRTVFRRLIPRKPQLDRAIRQWCYVYKLTGSPGTTSGYVVVYVPQVDSGADMPWYHPPVKSLAYVYEQTERESRLSIHFLPFLKSSQALSPRLHRTFLSLLQTFIRLAKSPPPTENHAASIGSHSIDSCLEPSALKDTILPQHTVQDTYTRLKQQYAKDLISRWVEKTEPSKHVFEDISIAAFLIELWKQIYPPGSFPGFIDLACGNGVLTYLLIREGYSGRGFDARRRITWKALEMEDYLDEMVCIPQPFLDHAPAELSLSRLQETGMKVHNGLFNGVFNGMVNGLFKPGTFIISNHADELTPWTPIIAFLSSPDSPLPFLAIPCCSHALSGAKHRYTPKDIYPSPNPSSINNREEQSASGDLKELRVAKVKAVNHQDDKSMYACLTRKVVALAHEVGSETELTLMRIPSTRNIGIVGNRKRTFAKNTVTSARFAGLGLDEMGRREEQVIRNNAAQSVEETINGLFLRECAMSGGLVEAARCWIERAQRLQKGRVRGKVNLGGKPEPGPEHG